MSIDRSSSLGDGGKSNKSNGNSNSNSNQREEGGNTGFNRFRNQLRGSPRPDSNVTVGSPSNGDGSGSDGVIGPRYARQSSAGATGRALHDGASASHPRAEENEDESGSRWSGGEEEVDDHPAEPTEGMKDCYDGVDSDDGEIDGGAQEVDDHQDERAGAEHEEGWSLPTPVNVHDFDAGFPGVEHGVSGDEEEEEGRDEDRDDEAEEGGKIDSANGYGVDRGSSITSGGTQSRHFSGQPEDDAQRNQRPRPVDRENVNNRPVFSASGSVRKVQKLAGDSDVFNRESHGSPTELPQDGESSDQPTQQFQDSPLQSPLFSGLSLPPAPLQEQQSHQRQEQEQEQEQEQAQQQQQQQQRNLSNSEEEEEKEQERGNLTASRSELFAIFGVNNSAATSSSSDVRSLFGARRGEVGGTGVDSDSSCESASRSELSPIFGAAGAATPSSTDVRSLFGAGRGEAGGAGVDSSRDSGTVSSSHFDHQGTRRSSVAVSSIYSQSDVDGGRDDSNHVDSMPLAAPEERDLDGGLAVMQASNGVDGGDDEDGAEEQGLKRKREDRQAFFQRRVGDGFLVLAKCYLTASSTIRGVKAEQREMLQDEEKTQERLVRFGKRVLEAARTMETRLQAAFAGGDDSGMEEEVPPVPPLNTRGHGHSLQAKADDTRTTGASGESMLDDRSQLATVPREDGVASRPAAHKSRGGGSSRGDSEWRAPHPVEAGASCTFNDGHGDYDDGERFSGGVVKGGRRFDRNSTGEGRDQGGSATEEASDAGSHNVRSIGDLALSDGGSGGSRPSASFTKRPRFYAAVSVVDGHQGMPHRRDGQQ